MARVLDLCGEHFNGDVVCITEDLVGMSVDASWFAAKLQLSRKADVQTNICPFKHKCMKGLGIEHPEPYASKLCMCKDVWQ